MIRCLNWLVFFHRKSECIFRVKSGFARLSEEDARFPGLCHIASLIIGKNAFFEKNREVQRNYRENKRINDEKPR